MLAAELGDWLQKNEDETTRVSSKVEQVLISKLEQALC
jgi:hypothetical protein